MNRPPDGFSVHARGESALWLRDDVADPLLAAGFHAPEELRPRAAALYEGRGAAFGVDVPGAGRVFVRPYLHGGLLRHVTADRYSGDGRFQDEVCTLEAARESGVPVPEPYGYVSRSAGLGTRRGWLLTREVPGAQDLLSFLADAPPAAERRAALTAAGEAMRLLHDAGFEHPDLHLKNLLLCPDGLVLVLDLDAARRRDSLDRARRLAGLFRFDRYAAKQVRTGASVSLADRVRVMKAYAGVDWPERDAVRELAARLARHIARHGHAPVEGAA